MVPDQLLMQMLVTWLAPPAPLAPVPPSVADQENSAPAKQTAKAAPARSDRPPLKVNACPTSLIFIKSNYKA